MRCYYVFVHGEFEWLAPPLKGEETSQPRGFYCHRYVLAADDVEAVGTAFNRVRHNFNKACDWITSGTANLLLEANEVSEAAFHMLLKPDVRNHVFYDDHD